MKIWNQCILGTALGKTANTYEEISTGIKPRVGAKYIVGFYALIVNTKPTADEATTPYIKIESADYNIASVQLHGGRIGAEGMAAHQATMTKKIFYPFSVPITGKQGGTLHFYVASVVANTEGWDCGIQLVTSDTMPSDFIKMLYLMGACDTFSDGDIAYEAAGAGNSATLAAWGANDADRIVVNGKNKRIEGICYTIGLNAETAAVPLCNYAELTCSDITDFTPQQHLVNYGANGALGTVINSINETGVNYLPWIFDGLPGTQVKIDIADINSLTGLTAGDGLLSVVFS